MENNDNEIRINKIPLKLFIEALTDAYNRGVDYVDIIGKAGDEQDSIGIAIKQEYFSPDIFDDDDDIEFVSFQNTNNITNNNTNNNMTLKDILNNNNFDSEKLPDNPNVVPFTRK